MERTAGQSRTGKKESGGGTEAAAITTYPFTVPSTGEKLYTVKPDFAHLATFINLVMEPYPDANQLTGQAKSVYEATVSGRLLDYFTRYGVRITEKQRVPGLKAVAKAYKEVGLKKMPKGRELIGKIVLLGFVVTPKDRMALLAHFYQLSGLASFNPANQRVIEA